VTLAARSLWAGYGGMTVLRDVSIVVPPGSVVALLGPNGAGKTTFLRVCAGELTPWRGSVALDGGHVTGVASHVLARRGVTYVPEGRAVFRSLSVRDNLRIMSATGNADRGFPAAIDAFPRLAGKLDQLAGTLSGGEQQMVALSRAFLTAPSYVLLDEVSMGLAPRVVDEIFDALRRLTAEGIAIVIVEQYVHKALELADYVYVLNKGQVALAGEAGEIDPAGLALNYLSGNRV